MHDATRATARRSTAATCLGLFLSCCGPSAAATEESVASTSSGADTSEHTAAPSAVVRVDGIVVHEGPLESLTAGQRAYLARLELVLAAYDAAPRAPVTYARDPGRWTDWSHQVLVPAFAGLDAETNRLVGEHPRASDETGRVRLFHVLLELVELHRAARFYEETSGGPPGHPGCPHDPPSHLAHFLTQLAARADACVGAIEEGSSLAPTREECARRGRWARELLSHATPPAPDECMEDMPSPGD